MAIDKDAVRLWGKISPDPELDELLDRLIAATTAHARRHYPMPDVDAEETSFDEDDVALWEQGILMQIARLWKRRGTPEGVIIFGSDGAVRVTKFDPDVSELLADFRVWNVG